MNSRPEETTVGGGQIVQLSVAPIPGMAGLIQRTAQSIDEMWQSIWHGSSRGEKLVIAVFLLVTGLAIPVIPIVLLARVIAN